MATYADGAAAWDAMQERLPDLVVLDILMPRMDGFELCRRLRGTLRRAADHLSHLARRGVRPRPRSRARGRRLSLQALLDPRAAGAGASVLLRRLALIRQRAPQAAESLLDVGALRLDLQRYQVSWRGALVPLTVTEFQILRALARHPGHVKTRQQLMQEGYPYDAFVSDRTIDSHIKRLRKKFELVDAAFDAIETVHGLGYRYRAVSGRERRLQSPLS